MNPSTTIDGYGHMLSSTSQHLSRQQAFPTAPFPEKHVHGVIDDLQRAEQAVQALREAGFNAEDIHLITSQEFVAAVEQRLQQQPRLAEALFRFFSSTDEGFFGDMYLREARRGHHILAVHLPKAERMEQVRDLLVPYQAHFIKYIGPWAVTDLPSASVSHR